MTLKCLAAVTGRQTHLFYLAFCRDKVGLDFQASVKLDECLCLLTHFQQHIPFPKKALDNNSFDLHMLYHDMSLQAFTMTPCKKLTRGEHRGAQRYVCVSADIKCLNNTVKFA